MSRGLGALQRDLLAKLWLRPHAAVAARDLVAEVLAERGVAAATGDPRWRAADVAVRRALAGLAKAGLAVASRPRGGGRQATRVLYAVSRAALRARRREEQLEELRQVLGRASELAHEQV